MVNCSVFDCSIQNNGSMLVACYGGLGMVLWNQLSVMDRDYL